MVTNFFALQDLKSIILGGENLFAIDCVAWQSLYPEHVLFNEYGPTEATVAVTAYKIESVNDGLPTGSVPIGKPGVNMACYILDSDHHVVSNGDIGELYLGGDCLARGYLNQPDFMGERFIKNPLIHGGIRLYKTGDLCRQLPNGDIEYIDRIDSQVKIRGFRIELAEIERYLLECPCISNVIVLTRENHYHEKQIIAYYILNTDGILFDFAQVQQYLNMKLPYYMIPSVFVRVEHFPLTENEKLDRDALPVPQFVSNQYYCAPQTQLEKTLAAIWAEELDQKIIGIENDFFELGGNSLSAARIVSSIASQLEKELSLYDFYEAGTISKLVPILEKTEKRKKETQDCRSELSVKPLFPLSDFQLLIWLCNNFEPNAQKINIVIRKRLQGRLNQDALLLAFKMAFKRHEVLVYRVFRFRPAQQIQYNLPFDIAERSLLSVSSDKSESILNESITELQYYHPWPKHKPMLMARLFHLQDDVDELQIGISHLVADFVSAEILLHDLSQFYLLCCKDSSAILRVEADRSHRKYVLQEQHYLQTHFNDDRLFWQEYLKDSFLFPFPRDQMVREDEALSHFSYSTYLEMSEQTLNKLQQFCALNCVGLGDGLTAALLLALSSCCDRGANQVNPIFISRVKSTRNNPNYDNTMGCFLRVDGIKVSFNNTHTMVSLVKQVQQADRETSSHQQSLSLIKLAAVNTFHQKRKRIKNYLIQTVSSAYTKLFRRLQLNPQVLHSCGRLFLYERDNHFLININIQTNLASPKPKQNKAYLFGFKTNIIKTYHSDLLKANNVFDVSFLRDDHQDTPYLVISAKLKPSLRQQIGAKLIQIIHSEAWDKSPESLLTASRQHDEKGIIASLDTCLLI